jgi:hypothetical protein
MCTACMYVGSMLVFMSVQNAWQIRLQVVRYVYRSTVCRKTPIRDIRLPGKFVDEFLKLVSYINSKKASLGGKN